MIGNDTRFKSLTQLLQYRKWRN